MDAGEFEQRYEEWSDRVYRYLVHLVGTGGLAEDLFQETWMKAIEHRDQLREGRRFGPWILRIARNLAFNQVRTRRRKGQVWIFSNLNNGADDSGEGLLERCRDRAPDPRQRAIEAQRRRILWETLTGLESEVQEMLQLRYFENLTLAEVAAVLGMPLGTVCTKVHRGLKAVRASMLEQGYSNLKAM